MSNAGAPVIPTDLLQYDSYVEDPKWQVKFTIIWTSVLGVFTLLALPAVVRYWRKWSKEFFGVREDWRGRYERIDNCSPSSATDGPCCQRTPSHGSAESLDVEKRSSGKVMLARMLSVLGSIFYWTPPGISINAGQFVLVTAYAVVVLVCVCTSAPLVSNPNRAGFLALAQLSPVFLLASKNSVFSLLAPQLFSYTKLNILHRWISRTLFLAAVVHGSLWIRNHLQWNIPIIGQQKETSGVAALGTLCVIVLTSLKVVRMWAWDVFYWVHFLAVPAFFITVCYHTMYAFPWIIPPVAFYGFDLLMRAGRFRLKDAHLIRVDNQMTLVHIPDCTSGYRAGQHVRLRVFFEGRMFESHPFSIMCAPSSESAQTCLTEQDVAAYYSSHSPSGDISPGIILGARVAGDWTKSLNMYAKRMEDEALSSEKEAVGSSSLNHRRIPIPVQVMFDGPYGGCEMELSEWERVLLVAGGSGATFALGVLDELVAACAVTDKREAAKIRTRRIDFVWCTKSIGSIQWLAPLLRSIATRASSPTSPISLRMTVYVTCMCSPEAIDVPGLEVLIGGRPEVEKLIRDMADDLGSVEVDARRSDEALSDTSSAEGVEKDVEKDVKKGRQWRGRLAVCASGPASLTRETANAVARYGAGGREVGLHTEVFSI